MLWIPQQIWFLPVVESAYNSQNAQVGLVMDKEWKQKTAIATNKLLLLIATVANFNDGLSLF